jgi:hypothetical protein
MWSGKIWEEREKGEGRGSRWQREEEDLGAQLLRTWHKVYIKHDDKLSLFCTGGVVRLKQIL